ncbi:MAG TPA: S8 family serine peptidase [Micromonosporaceae bacterium]
MSEFPTQLRHGSGAEVSLDPTMVLLALREPVPRDQVAERLRAAGLALENEVGREQRTRTEPVLINDTDQRYWVHTIDRSNVLDGLDQRLAATELPIDWAGPVYAAADVPGPGGRFCPLPYVLLVRSTAGGDRLARELAEAGLEIDEEQSRYLGEYRYARIRTRDRTAYQVRDQLLDKHPQGDLQVRFEHMPMAVPVTLIPNDPLFSQQWNMTRIGAPAAWDITTGDPSVIVCVLDTGCEQNHQDLNLVPGGGVNLGTMSAPGKPTGPQPDAGHGTCCAGIAAATINNAEGVSGVAGECPIMPVAFQTWSDVECAKGINYARTQVKPASVISMSFGQYAIGEGFGPVGWDFSIIDPEIAAAVAAGLVLVAATGNENTNLVNRYPARHPLVIAVGATDQTDHRKSPSSPDGEPWGSNYGPGISVCAPGVHIPTTDIKGAGGYSQDDYYLSFGGTSGATPHVSGLAALLKSRYPLLTNHQIRAIIERTAEKVGGTYAEVPGFADGTRTLELGYGRISLVKALDFADVFIRDYPGDGGAEPATPPGNNFWTTSDIVVRPADDNVFTPSDPAQSSMVQRGQTNYLYVRVTNAGPADARNVTVDARVVPFVGTEFVYPGDWSTVDANHVPPTPMMTTFAAVPMGDSVIAKFSISAAQVDTLWSWVQGMVGHPCLLAKVSSDNDHAFTTAATSGSLIVARRNNLAQRNLTVVPAAIGSTVEFPFMVGSAFSQTRFAKLVVDRRAMPAGISLELAMEPRRRRQGTGLRIMEPTFIDDEHDLVFVDRTRMEVRLGQLEGLVTLEPGSRFHYLEPTTVDVQYTDGGDVVVRRGERLLNIREPEASVGLVKRPMQQIPMVLRLTIPAEARQGQRFTVTVTQHNEHGDVIGGITFMAVAQPAVPAEAVVEAPPMVMAPERAGLPA